MCWFKTVYPPHANFCNNNIFAAAVANFCRSQIDYHKCSRVVANLHSSHRRVHSTFFNHRQQISCVRVRPQFCIHLRNEVHIQISLSLISFSTASQLACLPATFFCKCISMHTQKKSKTNKSSNNIKILKHKLCVYFHFFCFFWETDKCRHCTVHRRVYK